MTLKQIAFASIIQQWVQKNIDEYIKVSSNCVCFECDLDEDVIYIPIEDTPLDTAMYMRFIEETYDEYHFDPLVLGILHEVGHIMTYDEDLDKAREIAVLRMRLNFNTTTDDLVDYNFNYFRIPAELNATIWAVDFYQNNREECDRFGVMLNEQKRKNFK